MAPGRRRAGLVQVMRDILTPTAATGGAGISWLGTRLEVSRRLRRTRSSAPTGSSTARSCPTPSRAGCAASAKAGVVRPTCPSGTHPLPRARFEGAGLPPGHGVAGRRPAHRADVVESKRPRPPPPRVGPPSTLTRPSQHTESALPAHRVGRPTNPARGLTQLQDHRHSGQVRCYQARRAVRGEASCARRAQGRAAVRRRVRRGRSPPVARRTGGGRGRRSAAGGQQRVVRATLHDPPVLDHRDQVGMPDGGQPVRDHQRGPPLQRPRTSASCTAASDSESRCAVALVQHHHRRVGQQQPGDGEPLPLTAGEPVAALPHHGVQPVRHRVEQFAQPGPVQRLDQLGVGGLRAGVSAGWRGSCRGTGCPFLVTTPTAPRIASNSGPARPRRTARRRRSPRPYSRGSSPAMVDFPAPEEPTSATSETGRHVQVDPVQHLRAAPRVERGDLFQRRPGTPRTPAG